MDATAEPPAKRRKVDTSETTEPMEVELHEPDGQAIASHPVDEQYPPPAHVSSVSHFKSIGEYKTLYDESIGDPERFWGRMANEFLTWSRPFSKVRHGGFHDGDTAWFLGGKLNVSYNCVDRHAFSTPDKVAIIWEGDEPGTERKITYGELLREVCRVANALKAKGVRKGDVVAIYMPMVPEIAFCMLACARIGAPHSVVFAGFSAEALRDRILDADCRVVITADEGRRGGRTIPLKRTVDEALLACPNVRTVLVHRRTNAAVPFEAPRDVWLVDAVDAERPYCEPEELSAEDPLFLLYTSGSTGKPKGVMHTNAGYLLYTAMTHKYVFDCRPDDVYACVADVGWITGHSYVVYGPLANGVTTTMFESIPTYPDASRYWQLVARHKVTIFYTAPTAIRTLMRQGAAPVQAHDRSSLRILGSVGEPINPAAWRWYRDVVGNGNVAVVDTYWQTETGGIVLAPLPGVVPTKPGSATVPFFGIQPVVLDEKTGVPLPGNDVRGLLAISSPWPSLARTVHGDHPRYLKTYLRPFPGYYFTGDSVYRDKDGYYWIQGRVDDVINVSGHRLGTAELESALVAHPACSEAAVIGADDELTGQCIFAYCSLKAHFKESDDLVAELKLEVRKHIGPFATPKVIVLTPVLPKTRSGKIMRRLLRKIAGGETSKDQLGDISTLADTDVVDELIKRVQRATAKPAVAGKK